MKKLTLILIVLSFATICSFAVVFTLIKPRKQMVVELNATGYIGTRGHASLPENK